jgi:hypothetical protein
MSERHYERGRRDGRCNTYNPPHQKGLFEGLISNYTRAELEDRRDYDQGYDHGRKGR